VRSKPSLDTLEEDIRATRRRLGEILARADRDYGLRPVLHALSRVSKPPGDMAGVQRGKPSGLVLSAAAIAFAIGMLGARRVRRSKKSSAPAPDERS
jgi:hypothetical protein